MACSARGWLQETNFSGSGSAGRGGVVARDALSPEVYERFRRAVGRACQRINADPERYKEELVRPLARTGIGPELIAQVRERLKMPRYDPPEPYDEAAFGECYDWMREHDLVRPGLAYGDAAVAS